MENRRPVWLQVTGSQDSDEKEGEADDSEDESNVEEVSGSLKKKTVKQKVWPYGKSWEFKG